MKVKSDKHVVSGEHNSREFKLDGGKLSMFGRLWVTEDIKTLVETANLLQHEGYAIDDSLGDTQEEIVPFYRFVDYGNFTDDSERYFREDPNE